MKIMFGVRGRGRNNLAHRKSGGFVHKLQFLYGLFHALSAHCINHQTQFAGRHVDVPRFCNDFHRSYRSYRTYSFLVAAVAGAAPGAADFSASTSFWSFPPWRTNFRVGENSPSLWPTIFSTTRTGRKSYPLCTDTVKPTISGVMVDARAQVLMIFL